MNEIIWQIVLKCTLCNLFVASQDPPTLHVVCNGTHQNATTCYNPCFANSCNNLNRTVRPCPLYCEVGKCDCINGYYSLLSGKCVRMEQCPNICPGKKNEVNEKEWNLSKYYTVNSHYKLFINMWKRSISRLHLRLFTQRMRCLCISSRLFGEV